MRLLSRSSVTLFWALVASVVLHAGIVAMTFGGVPRAGVAAIAPRTLVATFTAVQVAAPEPTIIAATAPSVLAAQATALPMPPAPPPAAAAPEAPVAMPRGPNRGVAKLDVIARPLTDRNRLGDLLSRQLAEFPVEVGRPARLDGRVVARYPAAALRAGREASVAVWLIVDTQGLADEIQVIDGDEEFASEVVSALRAARFLPAEDNLKPIRYPLSLEFEFRVGGGDVAAGK